ncbi:MULTISPECIES: BMC domain-containing protein [Geobacillus]|nr:MULTISPECIES: BMC domain-containing protein [Geobacillus]
MKKYALGMIETIGLTSLIAAADEAAKAADIQIITYHKPDAGIVTVYFIGDVASVREAVSAGVKKAKQIGEYRTSHVIPRPSSNVINELVNKGRKKSETRKKSRARDSKSIDVAQVANMYTAQGGETLNDDGRL